MLFNFLFFYFTKDMRLEAYSLVQKIFEMNGNEN